MEVRQACKDLREECSKKEELQMLKALRCKLSMSMCGEELIGAGARVNTKQTDETREVG